MPTSVSTPARCKGCDRTMKPHYSSKLAAETTHQGHGMCAGCYTAWKRSGKERIPTRPGPSASVDHNAKALESYFANRRRRGVPAEGLRLAS